MEFNLTNEKLLQVFAIVREEESLFNCLNSTFSFNEVNTHTFKALNEE